MLGTHLAGSWKPHLQMKKPIGPTFIWGQTGPPDGLYVIFVLVETKMPAFTPNRSILNPRFEGYKFSFTPSSHLTHIPLSHYVTQSRSGTRVLAFEEVASRLRHNHLAVGEDSAIYVGEGGVVVLVQVEDEDPDADQRTINQEQVRFVPCWTITDTLIM